MIATKQLAVIYCSNWSNIIHMGYMTEVMRRLNATWTEQSPCPVKLQPYLTALQAAFQKEDQDYKVSQKSSLTELITAADQERDALLSQVLTMVDAMAKMVALPAKQQAAQTMKQLLDLYKPRATMALREETTQIKQWHQAYSANAAQTLAAQELGLTQVVADLVTKNDEVETLMAARDDESGHKADVVLKTDRTAVDEAMRDFTLMLNALALVDDDPTRFDELIIGLTETQAAFRQRYEDSRRANKRVRVVSLVVGTHYYSVASGWTWTTMAQKYPKAFALDPVPSAPGVEPVVLAVRIVSTDAAALKAGGLVLTFAGEVVSPAAEVVIEGEYELRPIE